jgi:golgi SNAP receptor complex member 2
MILVCILYLVALISPRVNTNTSTHRRVHPPTPYPTTTMNSLYTIGVRQTNSLQSDLDRLRNGDTSASLIGASVLTFHPTIANASVSPGQISASLAAMHRTVDDYDAIAKREIIKAKQEKAHMCVFSPLVSFLSPRIIPIPASSPFSNHQHRRVQKFRADYAELRSQFERFKNDAEASVRPSVQPSP